MKVYVLFYLCLLLNWSVTGNFIHAEEIIHYTFEPSSLDTVQNQAPYRAFDARRHCVYQENYVEGPNGKALGLVGEGDYVDVSAKGLWPLKQCTLSVVFKADVIKPSTIFCFYTADEKYFALQILDGKLILIDQQEASASERKRWILDEAFKAGRWYHCSLRIDGKTWRIQLNGRDAGAFNDTHTLNTLKPEALYLGADNHTIGPQRRLIGALDDFILTNNVTADYSSLDFQIDKTNHSGSQAVPTLRMWKKLKNEKPAVAGINPSTGEILINGSAYSPIIYAGAFLNYPYYLETARDASEKSGIHIFRQALGCHDFDSGIWWLGENRYDFSRVDRMLDAILMRDPHAYILVGVAVSPPNWWGKENPGDVALLDDGNRETRDITYYLATHSFSSLKWRKDSSIALKAFFQHIASTPYNSRIIGYQLLAGQYTEWLRWDLNHKEFRDYSPCELMAFRKWLKTVYGDQNALSKAWGQPVSFDEVQIPSKAQRTESGESYFMDPVKQRNVFDYNLFISEIQTDSLLYFAKLARELTQGKKLIGAYSGYVMDNALGRKRSFGVTSGQNCIGKAFQSKMLDFFCTPCSYDQLSIGEDGSSMGTVASVELNGSLWIDEADIRTVFTRNGGAAFNNAKTLDETMAVLWRSFGNSLIQRGGLWWFPISGPDTFSHDRIWNAFSLMRREMEYTASHPFVKNRKLAIAVIVDGTSLCLRRHSWNDPVAGNLVTLMRTVLARVGVETDYYVSTDLNKIPDDYKTYIFLNSFYLDDKQREIISKRFKRNNNLLVWLYGSGYYRNSDLSQPLDASAANISDLTGIKIVSSNKSGSTLSDVCGPYISLIPQAEERKLGIPDTYGPLFSVIDPEAISLAKYTQGELAGKPSVGLKKFGTWTSVYASVPKITPGFIRLLAQLGGAHVYSLSTPSSIIRIGNGHILIHTSRDDEIIINLPEIYKKVFDITTGQVVAENKQKFQVKLKKFRTALLRLEK